MDPSQQAECAVCGNAAFDLLDGLYFCSDCGTQSQDVREEVTDPTGGGGESTAFRRLIKSSTRKKAGEDGLDSVKQEETHLSQLEIFQLILQKQCDAMVALGVEPSIKEAVKLIWFHYLRFYGYAFTDSLTDKTTPPRREAIPSLCFPKEISEHLMSGSAVAESPSLSGALAVEETPKKRGRGRPRKDFSQLLSNSSKRRRMNEASMLGVLLKEEDDSFRRKSLKTSSRNRKRLKEDDEEPFNDRAKRVKTEKGEENKAFDLFPSDSHLFESSPEEDSTVSEKEEESGASGSDSDKELTGIELFLERRKVTQLVIGKGMLSYFSLKYTICLCYLGLLYIQQSILLSDLVRWTLLNKVPFHNFASILPRSITAKADIHAYMAIVPLTSDRVYYLTRALHSHLKLPPLPSPNPAPFCHTIIDRLKLSPCFHSLVDKALLSLHRPSSDSVLCHIDRRFDGECGALVLLLVRLIYKLDDLYEFQMSKLPSSTKAGSHPTCIPSTATAQSCDSDKDTTAATSSAIPTPPESHLYPWEDWVVLYLRSMREKFNEAVPTNKSELEYVSNYQKYVDFCRVKIFQETRPPPRDPIRRVVFNPDYFAKLSDIFRRYYSKVEQRSMVNVKSESGSSTCDGNAPGVSGANELEQLPPFVPRQMSLCQLCSDPRAPWRTYRSLKSYETCTGIRHRHLAGVNLSHSMTFLLNTTAQLIDLHPEELHEHLLRVESSFTSTLTSLKRIEAVVTDT